MATVDAMYCGLPVVITENVGIAPDVREAGAGLVVKKDVESVAGALIALLSDSARAKAMGERGRRLVAEKFSAPAVAAEMLRAYEEIVGEYKK